MNESVVFRQINYPQVLVSTPVDDSGRTGSRVVQDLPVRFDFPPVETAAISINDKIFPGKIDSSVSDFVSSKNLMLEYGGLMSMLKQQVYDKSWAAVFASKISVKSALSLLMSALGDIRSTKRYLTGDKEDKDLPSFISSMLAEMQNLESFIFGRVRSLLEVNLNDDEIRAVISGSSGTYAKSGTNSDRTVKNPFLERTFQNPQVTGNSKGSGKIKMDITPEGEKDLLSSAAQKLSSTINAMVMRAVRIINAATANPAENRVHLRQAARILETVRGIFDLFSTAHTGASIGNGEQITQLEGMITSLLNQPFKYPPKDEDQTPVKIVDETSNVGI